ncbi:MAG: transcriptional repressor [Spirochaetales bacterium]|nr:transcriptional repressor [Spirochaetales bacterium]
MRDCHKWGQKFQNYGLRLTISREAILEVLINTDKHLSAEDIFMAVHSNNPAIGLTTIYRTLELLKQTGIVTKFEFGHGKAKYELTEEYSKKKHHHHLICKKCRKVVDYTDFIMEEKEYINKAATGMQNKFGFDIDTHIIHFYGICPECKAE